MDDKNLFIACSLDVGVTYYTQGESRKAIEYWVEVLEMYKLTRRPKLNYSNT